MYSKDRAASGYKQYRPLPQAVFQSINRCIALILIIAALPVFLAVAVIILAVEGRPLFYASRRLGLQKNEYAMYKFRTLPQGSEKALARNFFTYAYQPLSFLTKFLRESRLDELPQLYNVLRGEMNFIGPRPVRPEIYQSMCRGIVNYDFRFNVLPGIVGLSQLFTPHSAPKKIRSLIDNNLIKRKKRLSYDALLLVFTLVVLARRILFMGYGILRVFFISRVLGRYEDKRVLDRIKHDNALCLVYPCGAYDREIFRERLVDINELYFCFESNRNQPGQELYFKLKIKSGKRKKTARVKGRLFRAGDRKHGPGYRYIYAYQAENAFNQYLIDQYFLKKSIYRL